MTLETIRQKTNELHAKTRRALLSSLATPLIVAGISAYGITWIGHPAARAMFALAFVWSIAGLYFVRRGLLPATPAGDAGFTTGIESYRREVQRRRHLSERFLLWSLGPVVLTLATFVVPLVRVAIERGMLLNAIPFVTMLVIWVAALFVIRIRDQRELRREIDQLNELERANG